MRSDRGNSTLTAGSFERLLAAFDPDREQAGERYEVLRRKLVTFFECRRTPSPEDEADETLSRLAARLESGEIVRSLAAYAYGVARLVALERARSPWVPLSGAEAGATISPLADEDDDARLVCLRRCLAGLPQEQRALVISYYQGAQSGRIRHRVQLAEGHGSMNALRIRVHRVRTALEQCVKGCVGPQR